MSIIPFNPGRGVEAMEAASEAGGKSGYSGYKRFKLAHNESAYVRFITSLDEMMTLRCHNGVPTKGAPAGANTAKFPPIMSAVCRYDKAFGGYYKDCWICDQKIANKWGNPIKANPKTFAFACLRVEHNGTMIDMPRDYTIKGEDGADKNIRERAVVLVEQAQNNFWDLLRPYGMRYGTLSDRDYHITRQGEDKETKYIPMHDGPDTLLHPGAEGWAVYAAELDKQNLKLDDIVQNLASDPFYARFFDTRVTVDAAGAVIPATGGQVAGVPAATPAQQAEADDKLLALRNSMLATSSPASAPAAASTDPWAAPAGVGAGATDPWATSAPAF